MHIFTSIQRDTKDILNWTNKINFKRKKQLYLCLADISKPRHIVCPFFALGAFFRYADFKVAASSDAAIYRLFMQSLSYEFYCSTS